MPIIRKGGGLSGKVCDTCKQWKMLADFPLDTKPGRFKGYRQPSCRACTVLTKDKPKYKR